MDANYVPVEIDMAGNNNSTSVWQKLKVVLWKNFIIRKHHWCLTLCEIAIPTILFILIAYTRAKIDGMGKIYVPTPTYSPLRSSQEFYYDKFNSETNIYYTPKNEFTSDLIYKVQLKLQLNAEAIKSFNSESDLVAYYETYGRNLTIIGIVFKDLPKDQPPKRLNYVMRPFERYLDWDTQHLFNQMQQYIPESGSVNYIHKGFIAIQMALDTSFIETVTSNKLPVDLLTMQEFPYPPYFNDMGITELFLYGLPLVTLFAFSLLCVAVLKRVVEEKSTGIKELMKMMGLKSWMLWVGWFIHAFVVNCFSVLLITFFMKVALWDAKYPPIEHCNGFVFIVFLMLYCAAGITFCFAISSFFSRPTLAMVVGILAWILSYSIPSGIIDEAPNMKWSRKVLFGFFPNMAMTYGYRAISLYESREVGVNWSNLFKSASGGKEDISMGNVFIMFIVDILLYMLITVYFENIKPGPYGLAKPPHYPILWIWNRFNKSSCKVKSEEDCSNADKYCKIEATGDLKKGIQIKNLYKNFGKETAVNGLSIDIYEGQITALLGHNGAGKTTTMSIITGMIGATSGAVLINGQDINMNMNRVRGSLGLCPQHNLQFTDLTVIEHLIFFGMLKGLSRCEAESTTYDLLQRMNLSSKKDSLASCLSGGMRRRLSLAIALIGNSKVLILDEPTSGLDPEARREIWDMLLSLRGSRTILITTHFMEEADVLGDRIAIMDHGRLICYGTSMFLKKEYGTGYHLTIIRDKEKFDHENQNQVNVITKVVQNNIKTAVLQSNSGNHLTYLLPHETKSQFSQLLAQLENEKDHLGITNIGMSVTTLEEVFLKVGDLTAKDHENKSLKRNSMGNDSNHSSNSADSIASKKSTGSKSLQLRLQSLLIKRWQVMRSRWLIFAVQVLIAIIITLLTLSLGENSSDTSSEQFAVFDFDLSKYDETGVVYGGTGYSNELAKMRSEFDKLVSLQRGIPQKVNEESVSDALIKKGIENIEYYKQHMIVAAEFNMSDSGEKVLNAMYSNRAAHGAPIALNLIMNSILKSILGEEYSITTANSPLPVIADNYLQEASEAQVAVLWFTLFPLGLLFLSGTFVLHPLAERTSNIKQLQLMCGVRSIFYWLMCYIFDLLSYLAAIVLILIFVIIYATISSSAFGSVNAIVALSVILLAYGLSIIPYSYLFSYKKTAAGGFASFIMSSLFISIIMTIVVVVMELSGDLYYEKLGENIKTIALLFPQFGLTYLSVQYSQKTVWNHNWLVKPPEHRNAKCRIDPNPCCDGYDTPQCVKYRSYFSGEHNITGGVVEMAASTLIYFAILLFLETTFVKRSFDSLVMYVYNLHTKKRKMDVTDYTKGNSNDDVLNEMNRVCNTLEREKSCKRDRQRSLEEGSNLHQESNEDDLLLVDKLEKIYWNNKVVKGVSFGIKPGDCFGLLGVNGAGKTTTFRMLTGDEPLLLGDARINDRSNKKVFISKDSSEYLEKVGYCPQFDAINEVLTGREMLTLFAQLRGISEGVDEEVNMWLGTLGLKDYADKPCGEYSGGNKRKLCIAIALIGNPLLVMLDEPTSGVDPVSRRKLWDTLSAVQNRQDKPSILLTSHSMEECEALCNKLAIMKAGQLECYGTIPELKRKYGKGFTVMLKLKPVLLSITVNPLSSNSNASTASNESRPLNESNKNLHSGRDSSKKIVEDPDEVKQLRSEFEEKYRGHCTLRDKHSGLLHYHIDDKTKRWSELFKEIEELKQRHPIIEDYNISETTLEEVFLSIARAEN